MRTHIVDVEEVPIVDLESVQLLKRFNVRCLPFLLTPGSSNTRSEVVDQGEFSTLRPDLQHEFPKIQPHVSMPALLLQTVVEVESVDIGHQAAMVFRRLVGHWENVLLRLDS